MNRGVCTQVNYRVFVIGQDLLQHENFLGVGLALGREFVQLGVFVFDLLFKKVTLVTIELIGLFKLIDQLLHFFFL